MNKLMDLNQLLLDSNTVNPKKVSTIVKWIFAHEGCTAENISTGTNLELNVVNRKLRELMYDNQAIRFQDNGYKIRFPHQPMNAKPTSKLSSLIADIHNLQLQLVESEMPIPHTVISQDLAEIIKKYV